MRLLITILLSVIALQTINCQDPTAGMGTFDFSSFNANNNNQDQSNNLFSSPTNPFGGSQSSTFGGSPTPDSPNGLADPLPMNSPFPVQGAPNANLPGTPQQMDNSIKGQTPNSMRPFPNSFGSPANSFGQVQNSMGQPQNSFEQAQNSIRQRPNSFDQNRNPFGQPQFSFQQQGDSFGPNSIEQPLNSFGQPQRNNRGDIGQQNTGFPPAQQTPEERWLTVGGSQLPQNTNPTVNGNINAGVPFNNLGFDPNNRNQFRPLNTGNQFDRRQFPNQNQMMRGFPNRMPPQRGFPNQFQMDMSRQFENFGTPGNDEMTFNEGAIGAGPAATLDSFNPTNPANQQNQNTQEPQLNGRPPFGDGPFGDGPPFGRPPMGFGGFMGPRPAVGMNGFQPMGRFQGGFMPRTMFGGPMFG